MAEIWPFGKETVTSQDVTARLNEVITRSLGGLPHSEIRDDPAGRTPFITLTLANGQRFGIEIRDLDGDDRYPAVPCIAHGCRNTPEPGQPRCAACRANPALPPLTNGTVMPLDELIRTDAARAHQDKTAAQALATTESADTCYDCGETPTVAGDPALDDHGPVRYCRTCAEVAANSGDPIAWGT